MEKETKSDNVVPRTAMIKKVAGGRNYCPAWEMVGPRKMGCRGASKSDRKENTAPLSPTKVHPKDNHGQFLIWSIAGGWKNPCMEDDEDQKNNANSLQGTSVVLRVRNPKQ